MQYLSSVQGPRQAHATTQPSLDIYFRLKNAIDQLKAVDTSAFCQHDTCVDVPHGSSCFCRTHQGVPSKDAALCFSCSSWHRAASFTAGCSTCRSCELDEEARMARKRKPDSLLSKGLEPLMCPNDAHLGAFEPGVGIMRLGPLSSGAAQQPHRGLQRLQSTSSHRSSAMTAADCAGFSLEAASRDYLAFLDRLQPPWSRPDAAIRQCNEAVQSPSQDLTPDIIQAGTGPSARPVHQPAEVQQQDPAVGTDAAMPPPPPPAAAGAAAAAAVAVMAEPSVVLPVARPTGLQHLDSVASSNGRSGRAGPLPTGQQAAATPAAAEAIMVPAPAWAMMVPPACPEDVLLHAAPGAPGPWDPLGGGKEQGYVRCKLPQSDQDQGPRGPLSLLADAAACAEDPAFKAEAPQASAPGVTAGHQIPAGRGGLTAHPWHPLGGNKVDRGACCWRPGCGRQGQQAQQGRKVRLCELCYNYISDWSDMDGGPPLWGWYNTNKRDVVAARQPAIDAAAWAAVDALLQKRRVSSGFISRKRELSIAAEKPYAGFWDKQPYLKGLDSLLSGMGVQPGPISKPFTPQELALLQLMERPGEVPPMGTSAGGAAPGGPVIGPGAAGRMGAAAAGGGVGRPTGEIVMLPAGPLPEGSFSVLQQQQVDLLQVDVAMHMAQQQVAKAAFVAANARGKADQ